MVLGFNTLVAATGEDDLNSKPFFNHQTNLWLHCTKIHEKILRQKYQNEKTKSSAFLVEGLALVDIYTPEN